MMLENDLRNFMALFFSALTVAIGNKFPALKNRNAISTLVTIVLIIVIIVAGVAIIVVLIISPGAPTTATITP